MQLTEITYDEARPVDSYGPGFFRVDGKIHQGAMIITATEVRDWGGFDDAEALLALAGQIDVLFVGTGREIAYLPRGLRDVLEAAGLGVEAMDTPAACRTYNVILSEGRRIAAAVLPV